MRGSWIPIALSLCIAAAPAVGGDAKKKAAGKPTERSVPITNCAGAGPLLPVRASDQRTLLEADDRDRVYEAILMRYPILRGYELGPRQIMLWRKGDEWLYVHLADRKAATDRAPADMCFTATVLATDFEFTPALIQKYFLRGATPA
jgi:hypothetical protein